MGKLRFFFMPDVILCWQGGTFGSVAYRELQVVNDKTRFIEDGGVPGDATVVDRTWRYVNKRGGPDRRFNNNRELPVVQYGVLRFSSSAGINIHLNTSSVPASAAFVTGWRTLQGRMASTEGRKLSAPRAQAHSSAAGPIAKALQVLGVGDSASDEELSAAYHRLAQMYHPDKVAGLASEFQVLAEQRMKEINAAYETLKRGRQAASGTAANHTPAQPDQNAPGGAGIAAAFAAESESARTLVEERQPYWEFLLTAELLRSRLGVLQREYAELNKIVLTGPKHALAGQAYMSLLHAKFDEFSSSVTVLARCGDQDLVAAWGKPGVQGDAVQILNTVNHLIDCCRGLMAWEAEILLADPPVNLKRLGTALRGTAGGVIDEVARLPGEIAHAVEAARAGAHNLRINLTFGSPPQLAVFNTEMETVKAHPEWLNS
jgi:hypothetical protein